jgi:hypothetical protein
VKQSPNALRALEARIRVLEIEYARLNERLRTVGAALGGAAPPGARHASVPEARSPSAGAKKATPRARTGGSRKWFEKGEALALFRKILKRPMRTRDLMVRVVAAKRTAQLPKDDLGRFKWAVHAALKEAIGANAIVRTDDGMIAAAPAGVQVAAKSPRKASVIRR